MTSSWKEGNRTISFYLPKPVRRQLAWQSAPEGVGPAAPFLCTYMGRSGNGRKPFRFLCNKSQTTAYNVYLLLYPHGIFREALLADPAFYARIFAALESLDTEDISGGGRVYGGGIYKMEPKELARIPAEFLVNIQGSDTWQLFDSLADGEHLPA